VFFSTVSRDDGTETGISPIIANAEMILLGAGCGTFGFPGC